MFFQVTNFFSELHNNIFVSNTTQRQLFSLFPVYEKAFFLHRVKSFHIQANSGAHYFFSLLNTAEKFSQYHLRQIFLHLNSGTSFFSEENHRPKM